VELTARIRAMAKIKAAHVSDRQEKQRLAAMVLERTGELQRELAGRRQAEEELRRAHAELIASYAAAPVALLLVDEDHRVTRLNDAARRLTARIAEEAIGLRVGEVLRCLHALDDRRARFARPSWARSRIGRDATKWKRRCPPPGMASGAC
jgi:PAS domain-containing protein